MTPHSACRANASHFQQGVQRRTPIHARDEDGTQVLASSRHRSRGSLNRLAKADMKQKWESLFPPFFPSLSLFSLSLAFRQHMKIKDKLLVPVFRMLYALPGDTSGHSVDVSLGRQTTGESTGVSLLPFHLGTDFPRHVGDISPGSTLSASLYRRPDVDPWTRGKEGSSTRTNSSSSGRRKRIRTTVPRIGWSFRSRQRNHEEREKR